MCTYKYINIYIVYTYMEYCTRVPWMTEQIRKKRNKEKKKKKKLIVNYENGSFTRTTN